MATNTLTFPPVDFEIQAAVEPSGFFDEQRVLMVGEKLAPGTATDGALLQDITPETDIDTLFGARAILTSMVLAFFKINPNTRLDIIPVEITGAQATGDFTLSGTATGKAQITLGVFSGETGTITIDVQVGDAATQITANINAAFAKLTNLPVDIVLDSSVLNLTASNPGDLGNHINLRASQIPTTTGITIVNLDTLTGGTGAFAGGDIFSAVLGERYQTIIYSEDLPIDQLQDFVNARFNDADGILDGIGVVAFDKTLSELITLAPTLTSQSLASIGNVNTNLFEYSSVISSIIGGVRAIRLTENINITSFLSGAIGNDTLGGPGLAARPYANTPLVTLPLMDVSDAIEAAEITQLNDLGISLLYTNGARDTTLLGELFSASDEASFRFINAIDTASAVREFFFNSFKTLFSQSRLTPGDLIENRPMVNKNSFIATSNQLYTQLAEEFDLTVSGETALDIFKAGTIISLDTLNAVVTVLYNEVPIVSQNRRTSTVVKIEFTVQDN